MRGRQELDRSGPVQEPVLRAPDGSHAAGTDARLDLVAFGDRSWLHVRSLDSRGALPPYLPPQSQTRKPPPYQKPKPETRTRKQKPKVKANPTTNEEQYQ